MSNQLLEQVKSLFNHDVVKLAAGQFGESETVVNKALSGIIPAILGGVAQKVQTPGGASSVFDLLGQASGEGANISEIVGNPQKLSAGWDQVKGLFGTQSDNLLGKLASFTGSKVSTITSLLGMAAPMIFSFLGKFFKEKGIGASGLSHFFEGEKSSLGAALPAGLGLSGIFNHGFGDSSHQKPHIPVIEPEKSSSGNKLLWPLLIFAVLALLIWWIVSNQKKPEVDVPTVSETVEPVVSSVAGTLDSLGNFVYDVGPLKEITLPGGLTINVGVNSSEAKLFNFLNDNSITVDTLDKTKGWISLDRVFFETGKDILRPEFVNQLENIAAILKAFPGSSIKIGGYTDNTGDSALNVTLSSGRALAAYNKLKGLGIDAGRLASEGYGPMHPIATNDTPEGRAMNRRVDLRVTKK